MTNPESAGSNDRPSSSQPTVEGIPRKRRGEHFSAWWQRLTDDQAHGVTTASRFIGVTPQSIFKDYARFEDESD